MDTVMPKISVIIPIFNREKYLEKCLNSIIYQTYPNLEIICVNDGSTDKSLEILETFAQKDDRIKIITQENQGQSSARNTGIDNATGDYISFIDSDDWVYLTLYQTFVDTINKTEQPNLDIWMFNINSYVEGENDVTRRLVMQVNDWNNHQSDFSIHTFDDCRKPFINNISACNKILRREFLNDLDLRFPQTSKYEDQYFSTKALLNAKTIIINENAFYRYRNVTSGTVTTSKSEKVFDIFTISKMVSDEVKKLGLYEKQKYALFQYKFLSYFTNYAMCPQNLKEKYFNTMKQTLVEIEDNDLDKNISKMLRNYEIFNFVKHASFAQFQSQVG